MHVPKVLETNFFYRTILRAAFEVSFSIRKVFLKQKVNGETAFALMNLFYVQIQEPARRPTTTRAFVFLAKFIIAKYLTQEVSDDFSVYVSEAAPVAFL